MARTRKTLTTRVRVVYGSGQIRTGNARDFNPPLFHWSY